MDEVIVNWEGPLTPDAAVSRIHTDEDFGLYQVYGRYLVNGANMLLYIGKAERQTFGARLAQHRKNWLDREEGVEILLGKLDPSCFKPRSADPKWADWTDKLGRAEALTIAVHTPPYNSHYIVGYGRGPLKIVNRGTCGLLFETFDSVGPVPKTGPAYVRGPRLVVPGSPYGSKEGDVGWRKACREVASCHFVAPTFPTRKPVRIVARFHLPPKARACDLDNATKLLIDGLGAGGLFNRTKGARSAFDTEDHLVQRIEVEKRIDTNPRAEVEVWVAAT